VSLDGNLRVFSVTEIFQMLGMQRKSGILTVEGSKDTVTIGFFNGSIVSVDSTSRPLEDRLGSLLVQAGLLSDEGRSRALEAQMKRHQRLGRLLLSMDLVRAEDLREALRIQVQKIVFAAFAWTEGRFQFAPQAVVEQDTELFPPLPTESILLEAARTFDELPAAERKFNSNDVVFHRVPHAHALRLLAGPTSEEGTLEVSRREAETWKWVDGRRSVNEILERAFLSDLDALKGISDLLDRGLIEEGTVRETPIAVIEERPGGHPVAAIGRWLPLLALATLSFFLIPRNRANLLFQAPLQNPPARDLFQATSLARLQTVGRGIRTYYGSTGRYPRTLLDLVVGQVLDEDSLRDPYGRFYRYILRSEDGKFALYGRTAAGAIDLDLIHEGQLAPVSEVRPVTVIPQPTPADDRPTGVEVVR
jgi:uncharacterized protein DUF4388